MRVAVVVALGGQAPDPEVVALLGRVGEERVGRAGGGLVAADFAQRDAAVGGRGGSRFLWPSRRLGLEEQVKTLHPFLPWMVLLAPTRPLFPSRQSLSSSTPEVGELDKRSLLSSDE